MRPRKLVTQTQSLKGEFLNFKEYDSLEEILEEEENFDVTFDEKNQILIIKEPSYAELAVYRLDGVVFHISYLWMPLFRFNDWEENLDQGLMGDNTFFAVPENDEEISRRVIRKLEDAEFLVGSFEGF